MPRVLSSTDELEVAVRYKLGMSTLRLARMLDVDESTIRRILDRQEVPRRPRQMRSVVSTETIRLLRAKGWSWQRIATATGLSPSGVRKRYREG